MGSLIYRIRGVANQASGKTKVVLGKAIGSQEMEREGLVQQAKGRMQRKAAETKITFSKIRRHSQ